MHLFVVVEFATIFEAIRQIVPGVGGELQLTDALRVLLQEGKEIVCVPLAPGEHRLDIGNFQSYFQAFIELSFTDPEYGEVLQAWAQHLLRREAEFEQTLHPPAAGRQTARQRVLIATP